MPRVELREPWRAFLFALDGLMSGPTELHCLGGFVVSELYGLSRSTADIDVLVVRAQGGPAHLAALGGQGSDLHKKYGLRIDVVTVAQVPEDYEERLVDFEVDGLSWGPDWMPRCFENATRTSWPGSQVALNAKLGR